MTTTKTKKTNKPLPELQPNPFQFEILELVSAQRTVAKKAEVLQKYRNEGLTAILIWNFDDTALSALPEGDVPYSRVEEQSATNESLSSSLEKLNKVQGLSKMDEVVRKRATSIRKEWQNFYNYLQGGNPGLTNLRRETMFIQMLEGLHPKEAEIMILVKDKRLQEKYKITQSAVAEAYPDIQWGGRS
jgi:hypothetical protein